MSPCWSGWPPGVEYPPHRHAGTEELYLLKGELWIGDKKLYPGDYNRAEPGTADMRVWSETGCACLLITSPSDILSRAVFSKCRHSPRHQVFSSVF